MFAIARSPFSAFLSRTALILALATAASPAATASPASPPPDSSAPGRSAPPHAVGGPRAVVSMEDWVKTRARLTPGDLVASASLEELGVRYTWGGDDPGKGFDCSGLVLFVFRKTVGLELPHRARLQRKLGKPVPLAELAPGDLVFFNTRGNPGSHVGIYIGKQRFVHAPSRKARVRVDTLDNRYWAKRYTGARRFELPAPDATMIADEAA